MDAPGEQKPDPEEEHIPLIVPDDDTPEFGPAQPAPAKNYANPCKAQNRWGNPCGFPPVTGKDYCLAHDPERKEELAAFRKVNGKKTGSLKRKRQRRLRSPQHTIFYIERYLQRFHERFPEPNLEEVTKIAGLLRVQLQAMWIQHQIRQSKDVGDPNGMKNVPWRLTGSS